jgi:hypothetical protein
MSRSLLLALLVTASSFRPAEAKERKVVEQVLPAKRQGRTSRSRARPYRPARPEPCPSASCGPTSPPCRCPPKTSMAQAGYPEPATRLIG